nr:pentatricopeptide repeat-containing protein At5g62370 [Ipomoea batatas]
MAKYRSFPHNPLQPLFFSRKIPFTSCPLPLESPPQSATGALPDGPRVMCFSALEQLIRRGLVNSAQKLVQRIIKHSSSVHEAVSAVDFAVSRGVELDIKSYDFLIRKLATCGKARMAEAVYVDFILSRGVEPDHYLLNSMVLCYSKLGKLEEAKSQFDRLVAMEIMPCSAACSEIISEFCAQNRVLEGFCVFLEVCDAEFVLNLRCYNGLVDGLSSRGYIDEALCVYGFMCDKGVPPTVHLLKKLVFMLCRSERVEEAELLSLNMESFGFFLDKVMYTALINGYCLKRSMRMAMRLFYRMLKTGCQPDNYTYNTLMHGFLNLGMLEKIPVLHHQMEELRLKLNVVSYQIMISKCCKVCKVDCALALLNSMIQCNLAPTVYCYTPLLAALYKENRLAEVDQLYNQLFDHGLLPDEVLFFTVVKNHVEGHEINLAHNFVAEIARNGCGIDLSDICSTSSKSADDIMLETDLLLEEIFSRNSVLACVAFNIYMIALCYGGRLEAALLCMDKMSNLSLQPSLPAYNSMIRCLYQKGRGEDAKSLVKVMQDQGLVPSMLTFLIMANEQCKQGDLPSAIGILDKLEDSGMKPSVAIYDSIIGHLIREKRIPEALELFARMREAGTLPDETMFVTMINGLSKNGQAIAAHELFEKMLECGIRPGYRAYTALINGFVKKNMIAKGCLYLDRMLKEGFMPNAALYTALINQFLRKGEIGFALQLVDLMERSQIEQDMITHVALVSGVCRNIRYISRKWHESQRQFEKAKYMLYHLLCQYTNFSKGKDLNFFVSSRKELKVFALKLINKVNETNFLPNLYLHNGVIAGYCWANNMQGAYHHLDMMIRKELLPNHVTFTILIDGHIQNGKIDLAVNLFNKMNELGCVPDNIVYNTMIRGFCKAGRLLDALSVSNTMLKKGLSPSKASYENLLQCFCANKLTVHALKILEDMLAHEYIPCGFNLNWLVCILFWILHLEGFYLMRGSSLKLKIVKLLQGDVETTKWVRLQVNGSEVGSNAKLPANSMEGADTLDDDTFSQNSNIQSHLNLALLGVEEDSVSVSSIEQHIPLEDYLRGRWSRSSSLD